MNLKGHTYSESTNDLITLDWVDLTIPERGPPHEWDPDILEALQNLPQPPEDDDHE